jgi:hypothetical protein
MTELFKNAVLPSFIIFGINLIFSFFINNIFYNENGVIDISRSIKVKEMEYKQSILISNLSTDLVKNIIFSGTDSLIVLNVEKSNLELIVKGNTLVVNNILPKRNESIIITYRSNTENNGFIPINYKDLNFKDNSMKTSFFDKIRENLVSSLFLLLFGIIVFGYINNQFLREREINQKKLSNTIETIEYQNRLSKQNTILINELKEDNKFTNSRLTKIRILLFKQVQDLKTENNFYKYLLKKILETKFKEDLKMDDLTNIITKNLNTYSTKSLDLEKSIGYIDVVTQILKEKMENESKESGIK